MLAHTKRVWCIYFELPGGKNLVCSAMPKGKKVPDEETERLLQELSDFVSDLLSRGQVPRLQDVVDYARSEERYRKLSEKAIRQKIRLHPSYADNVSQQRATKRHKKQRAVAGSSLGCLHADLGFFSVTSDYETPKTYRSGYLVARDVLSRYVYAVPLRGSKSKEALIAALKELLAQHDRVFGEDGHRIQSIAFDKERAMMSRAVGEFLKERKIRLHAFSFSASKAKGAENAIRYIRNTMKRLTYAVSDKRWWRHLSATVKALNSRPVYVNKKNLGFAPEDVNSKTLPAFLEALEKHAPHIHWSQFQVDPRQVQFKFQVADVVRPKLIAVSSAAIGTKRSETALADARFQVAQQFAHVSSGLDLIKSYKCVRIDDGRHEEEIFEEDDIALSSSAPDRP